MIGFSTRLALMLAGALLLCVAAGLPARAADRYQIDPAHSDVVFGVDHLGFSKVWGRFNEIDGSMVIDEDDPSRSRVVVVLQTASIDTGHAKRDEVLRGPDFLDAASYPAIIYRSQEVERVGERTARIYGALTLRGVTRPVTLYMTLNRIAEHPLRPGVFVAGFSGRATIRRSEFGITTGVPVLGDEVEILLEVEAIRK
jgi:polyisoprenoid-binding protein YceI